MNLVLPLLSVLMEGGVKSEIWCDMPGTCGGFQYSLELTDEKRDVDHLVTSSWCWMAADSEQTHKYYEESENKEQKMDSKSKWESFIQIDKEVKKKVSLLNRNSSLEAWQDCLDHLLSTERGHHYLCNEKISDGCSFPSGKWTFQHHCAYHNAPLEVVTEMVEQGFPMTYKDNEGKIPFDHVALENTEEYKSLFQPKYRMSNLDLQKLGKIEQKFHEVINSRCKDLVDKHNLVLPLLSVLMEGKETIGNIWCAIPGMYGGFDYSLVLTADKSNVDHLVTSSWCRVAGGSGQRHECYEDKWVLVDQGFV